MSLPSIVRFTIGFVVVGLGLVVVDALQPKNAERSAQASALVASIRAQQLSAVSATAERPARPQRPTLPQAAPTLPPSVEVDLDLYGESVSDDWNPLAEVGIEPVAVEIGS